MPKLEEIVSHVTMVLERRISLDEFGDWMLSYTGDIMFRSGADKATRELANFVSSK
jgi:hypothetical protein